MWEDTGKLILYKLKMLNGTPKVYESVQIMPDYSWQAKLCGKPLHHHSQLLQDTPEFLSTPTEVREVLTKLECNGKICTGNEDARFLTAAASRGGKFYNRASKYYIMCC